MIEMVPFSAQDILKMPIANSKHTTVGQAILDKAWHKVSEERRAELEATGYESFVQYQRTDAGQCIYMACFRANNPESLN